MLRHRLHLSLLKGESPVMSLYKYVKFETLKGILEGSIRFSQPGAFNDPFEMVPELYVPEGWRSEKIDIRFSLTAPRREPLVGVLDDSFVSSYCSDQNSRGILASLNEAVGILCLSKNDSSLSMWAHYADSYRGALVKFDETHEFFSGHFEVKYSEHRPKVDIASYTDADEPIPIAELCVKAKEWEHEKEVRVVRNLADCRCVDTANGFPVYVMDVPLDCIESVILGERMPVFQQREVWELVKDVENVSLHLEAVSNWGYEFRREHIKLVGMKNPILSPRTGHIFADLKGTVGDLARYQLEKHPLSGMMNDTL